MGSAWADAAAANASESAAACRETGKDMMIYVTDNRPTSPSAR
jgi:hypothetical protein